jgi:hypothetical protein
MISMAGTLSKRSLKELQGIPMTIADRAFVAVPVEVLQNLLRAPRSVPSKEVPPGSVEALAFAGEAIARHLKAARRTAGLTQGEIAARMGISQTRVSLGERGAVPVSTVFVKRWLSACGLPEDWRNGPQA